MNDTTHPGAGFGVPWPTSDHRARVPGTSILPGSGRAAPAVRGMLDQAAQGTPDTIDHLADSAVPSAPQPGGRGAGDALQAKPEHWRATRGPWVQSVRTAVRRNPLASMVAAVALGAAIVRLVR